MNSDILKRLLELDLGEAWVFIVDVVRNPATNVTAFALILAAITVVMLVVVLLLLLVFMSGSDEDEDEEAREIAATPVAPVVAAEVVPLTPEQLRERRVKRTIASLVWLLIFGVVWVVGGTVSRANTLCLSCHAGTIHVLAAQEETKGDPHGEVACVSCHETPNIVASVTTAVPGRAMHFVGGFVRESYATGYGAPVANRSCAGCHEDILTGVFVNEERGVRVSHAEPLEARALCSDCHTPRPGTGVINRYTVGMDPCMRCHDQEVASAECSFCHTKDVGHAVQTAGTFKPQRHDQKIDCGGCHDQRTCDACHGMRMPHSIDFMGAGHARAGVEDIWFNEGKLCSRCHTDTRRPCTKCHNTMPSHGVDYMPEGHQSADPNNNGCDQCHGKNAWIVGRNYCGLCHPRYDKVREPVRQ